MKPIINMKNQKVLASIAFVPVYFVILYHSGNWNHILNTTFNSTLMSEPSSRQQSKLSMKFKLENVQFWKNDILCRRTHLDNNLNMTSETLSNFDISCDKANSTCSVKIYALGWSKERKTVGGDMFLLWAEQTNGDGRTVGHVTDNGNGTYTGIIKFQWTGKTAIKVKLGCTLENFCRRKNAMVKYGNSVFAIKIPWGMKSMFQNNHTREETRCGIYDKIQGYYTLCNLTHLNDGSPWFCGKPNNLKLNCEDIFEYNVGNFMRLSGDPYPNSSEVISKFGHGILKRAVTLIHVIPVKHKQPKTICRSVSKRQSWLSTEGYYLNGKWNMPYCSSKISFSKEAYRTCLKNKTMVVLGDSTVRDYASYFLSQTISVPLIDLKHRKGKHNTYHPASDFKQYGVRIIYKKHELPFHHTHVPINGVTSLATELTKLARNNIPGDDLIVLINYNSHMHAYPPDEVRVRLKMIVAALDVLFKEKPSVSVFLKGPHVHFSDNRFFDLRVALIHKDMIFEEFQHLFDKIIYLDVWSITTAFNNEVLHPVSNVLRSQIQQFMSYIC